MYKDVINLNGEWSAVGKSLDNKTIELSAIVPGSALSDIINNGIVETDNDIFYRDNDRLFQEYENYTFVYTKKFDVEQLFEKSVLFFGRLDTYCDVYLNDKHLAHCQNGNISYEFDVTDVLKLGENTIEVYFNSPVLAVRGAKEHGGAFTHERMRTRRTQCSYSWDWTARFLTCGISGDVYIKGVPATQYVSDVYINTERIVGNAAIVSVDVEFENYKNGAMFEFSILDDSKNVVAHDKMFCTENMARLFFTVNNVKLWWPNGYGEQNMYSFVASDDMGMVYETRFGIRTVDILEIRDEEGSENYNKCIELKKTEFGKEYDLSDEYSGFVLLINGQPIMCKGANWVPCEPFCTGDKSEKITEILELSKEAGVNMIRVWGGGQFESEHFYDECTRLGILVTQDFLMACGKYPEDEQWFLDELKNEAEYVSRLIRNKTCLVWWSGDNENAIWSQNTDVDYPGKKSAYKAIAPVLYKNDPHRRLLPSSPYGGARFGSNTVGTTHNTQFMGTMFAYFERDDITEYKELFKSFKARFIAEEPTMGLSPYSSLCKYMTDEDIFGDDTAMLLYHTKGNPALKKELFEYMTTIAEKMLGTFENGADRLFKAQYVQYEWLRMSLEQARRDKEFSSGVIYWMLNDCWPAASGWSLIDFYGKPKASYYSFKKAAKQVIASFDEEDSKCRLYICNDGEQKNVEVKVYRAKIGTDNFEVIFDKNITAKKDISSVIFEISADELAEGTYLIADVMSEGALYDRTFYKKGMLELKKCDELTEWKQEGKYLTLEAKGYIHAIELGGDGVYDDNFFSLLPGEKRQICIDDEKTKVVAAYTFKN